MCSRQAGMQPSACGCQACALSARLAHLKFTFWQHISSLAGAAPVKAGARTTSSQAARDGLCKLPRASRSPLQVRPPCRSASPPSTSAAGGALAAASSCGRSAPRPAGPSPATAWLPGGAAGAPLAGSARNQGLCHYSGNLHPQTVLSCTVQCMHACRPRPRLAECGGYEFIAASCAQGLPRGTSGRVRAAAWGPRGAGHLQTGGPAQHRPPARAAATGGAPPAPGRAAACPAAAWTPSRRPAAAARPPAPGAAPAACPGAPTSAAAGRARPRPATRAPTRRPPTRPARTQRN